MTPLIMSFVGWVVWWRSGASVGLALAGVLPADKDAASAVAAAIRVRFWRVAVERTLIVIPRLGSVGAPLICGR